MKTGFIGVGNMGGALLRGLLDSGRLHSEDVLICGRDKEKTIRQAEEFHVKAAECHEELVEKCHVIFLGVSPQTFPLVMPRIKTTYKKEKILISMAAGITLEQMEETLGCEAKIIRIMPNTPAAACAMITSVTPNKNVSAEELEQILELLSGAGRAEVTEEEQIATVGAAGGSSPAITYLYIDALKNAAEKRGIPGKKARVIAAQAVLGAAKMALESDEPLAQMAADVCTPGGTTIEGINYLKEERFEEKIEMAMKKMMDRADELSRGKM